jgi:hypothetical protein
MEAVLCRFHLKFRTKPHVRSRITPHAQISDLCASIPGENRDGVVRVLYY